MRPGKPVYVGALNSSLVFGLPGNPVSAFTAAQVLMRPVVDALQSYNPVPNYQIRARLHGEMKVKPGRRTYHLAQLFYRQSELGVRIAKTASSGDVLSIERANAFIVTEGDAKPIEAGEQVTVQLWNPLDPRTRDLEFTH